MIDPYWVIAGLVICLVLVACWLLVRGLPPGQVPDPDQDRV